MTISQRLGRHARTAGLLILGLCVVAVLHDLNLAAAACDRVAVLSRGSVVADGPPAEVLTEARVREVWEVPVWRGENGATGAAVVLPALPRP